MALIAAAVCPAPPLLVPAVATGEQVAVRAPALAAARWLVATEPDLVVVVGDGPRTAAYGSGDSGSFEGFGVDLRVPLGPRVCAGAPVLPPSLTVAAWLLRETGWTGDRQGYAIAADAQPQDAAAAGRQLAALDGRVALLVAADGSACRTEKAPGSLDPRARAFDATAATALAAADPATLLALDPALARDLLAAGRASWQVLAGAAGAVPMRGRVDYDDAPYGVGYLVAIWWPVGSGVGEEIA